MAQRLSRRLVVRAFVDGLTRGKDRKALVRSLAAYLIETKQAKQLDSYLADISRELTRHGIATAEVTSVHKLSAGVAESLKQIVARHTGAHRVALNQTIDESLIGGVRLSFDGLEIDESVRTKLNRLQA
ncbi:F0F1 ATP synthase subunit delta [Candidatus Saccharibacteria bacterium]|nr:F0F1 ATP synthase subunit delta [Candidatus Saccharibacteria bacterium]